MPNASPGAYPRIVYVRYTPKFEAVDFSTPLNTPFEVNIPLQALVQEAEAKDCAVVVQCALVPLEEIYGEPVQEAPNEPESGSEQQPG